MKEFELGPNEHVVFQIRKHWFIFFVELLPYAIIAIIPFAIPHLIVLAPPLARTMLGIWLLITWTGAWSAFTKYFLNIWILTNERIVEIKQRSYFNREVSSLLLSRVQDVTTDVIGVLSSLLDIGHINVQSAGTTEYFHMHGIHRPEQLRDLILKYTPQEKASGV